MPRNGNTTARGFGAPHQKRRAEWKPLVEAGGVTCARCRKPIMPGTHWDLDHTESRDGYLGPSHRSCNRAAGARKVNATRKRRTRLTW